MSKVITFSRVFPAHHPKKGEPTGFPEKIWNWIWDNTDFPYCNIPEMLRMLNPEMIKEIGDMHDEINVEECNFKRHTIRAGERFKAGEYFSPRVWSGRPYNSKQIILADDILIKKVYRFEIDACGVPSINGKYLDIDLDAAFSDDQLDAYELLALNDGLELDDFIQWFKVHPKAKEQSFVGQIICWDDSINY